MKSRTIYLMLFLILVLVVILFLKSRVQKPQQSQPPPQASPLQNEQVTNFTIVSTSISDQSVGINEPIKLQFNQPLGNLVYSIDPQITLKQGSGSNPNEITLSPPDAWAFNTSYTLKISATSSSISNQTLDKDYSFTFKTPPYSGI